MTSFFKTTLRILILTAGTGLLAAGSFPDLPSIYVHYAVDDERNGILPGLVENFTESEVEVGTDRLRLADLGFDSLTYPKGLGYGAPVYFSSTGKLPEPLLPEKPYYIVPAPDGGYRVYPVATDADATIQPGGVPGERVFPAQNVVQGVGSVVFRDGGTGRHRLYSKPQLFQFADLSGTGFDAFARSLKNRHMMLELDKDAEGRRFARTAGALVRENWIGSYNAYGPTFFQGPSEKRPGARERVGGKRVVYQIFVVRVRSYQERQVLKFMAEPKDIQIGKGQIFHAADARAANRFVDGDLIQAKAYGAGRLPSPLQEGTDYFASKIDGKNIALHATREDARKRMNPIAFTDGGSGTFLFWAPERVADSRRWSFFAEILAPDSGGNTLSARLMESVKSGILKNATAFAISGPQNGEILGPVLADLSPVVLWTPPRASLPPPLQSGVRYWVGKAGDSAIRLYESLESARAGSGKTTAESPCIKFTGPGSGESLLSMDDNSAGVAYGTLSKALPVFERRIPFDTLQILVFKIDFDPQDHAAAYQTLGINEVVTEGIELDRPKGHTPEAVKEPFPAWTLFNSAQGHVPIDLDLYEIVFGSSSEAVPDGEILKIVDHLKAKYGIRGELAP